jgi:hypothetical protein
MLGAPANPPCGSGQRGLLPFLAALILILFTAALPALAQNAPAEAAPPESPPPKLSAEQLDELVAPIALYPDALLAQVLMASAYPMDVVAADRFLQKNPKLSGDEMEQALQDKPWDMSVKTLTHFPSVLKYMDENLDWTQALGDAFVNQQSDVMAAAQHLREEANAAGNLKSGPQQTVTTTADNAIVIAPTDGQTVYVPQYNPEVVYTQAPATTVVTQPSTTVVTESGSSSRDVLASGRLGFAGGAIVGGLIADNNNWCDWGGGGVYPPPYYRGGGGCRVGAIRRPAGTPTAGTRGPLRQQQRQYRRYKHQQRVRALAGQYQPAVGQRSRTGRHQPVDRQSRFRVWQQPRCGQ